MTFTNPITGGQGTLVRPAIKSQDYVPGSSGWSINRDGSAEFNNVVIRDGEIVSGTELFYNGTPAAGNLVASISGTSGTDPYGNFYFAGITSYDSSGRYINMENGFVTISSPLNSFSAGIQASQPETLLLFSGQTAVLTAAAELQLTAGVEGGTTGTADAAKVYVTGSSAFDTATDLVMPDRGSIFPLSATWQTPAMGAGWANGPGGSGSYPPLKWRKDGLDNVHIFGVFHATSTSPGVIASGFPGVNMTNLGGVSVAGALPRFQGGAGTIAAYLNNSGELRSALGPTIAVGDTFMINAKVPLGNLT